MLGRPVGHTALPGAVAAWAAERGANVVLAPVSLAPSALPDFLAALREMDNCDGAVVTAPMKQAANGLMDSLSDAARIAEAVNVVRRDASGALAGDNTDGLGMRRALADAGFAPEGARILVFGCGGAGSAIAAALAAGRIDLCDPSAPRAEALAARLGARVVPPPETVAAYDLVVNATPVGSSGAELVHDLAGLRPDAVVADTVANAEAFLDRARAAGCRTVSGTAMAEAQMPLVLDAFGWRGAP